MFDRPKHTVGCSGNGRRRRRRRRRRGRLRKRWKGEVERDLQVLGVRSWRELVAERKNWKDRPGQSPQWAVEPVFNRPKPTMGCRTSVQQAKAHNGL